MDGPGIVAVGMVCLLSTSIGAWGSHRICGAGAQVVDFVEMIFEKLTGLKLSRGWACDGHEDLCSNGERRRQEAREPTDTRRIRTAILKMLAG